MTHDPRSDNDSNSIDDDPRLTEANRELAALAAQRLDGDADPPPDVSFPPTPIQTVSPLPTAPAPALRLPPTVRLSASANRGEVLDICLRHADQMNDLPRGITEQMDLTEGEKRLLRLFWIFQEVYPRLTVPGSPPPPLKCFPFSQDLTKGVLAGFNAKGVLRAQHSPGGRNRAIRTFRKFEDCAVLAMEVKAIPTVLATLWRWLLEDLPAGIARRVWDEILHL